MLLNDYIYFSSRLDKFADKLLLSLCKQTNDYPIPKEIKTLGQLIRTTISPQISFPIFNYRNDE